MDAVREARLEELDTYITRRNNTAAQYISAWTIMDLCLEAEDCPGSRVE